MASQPVRRPAGIRHVAVMIEQHYHNAHHLGIYQGIQQYAMETGRWRVVVDPFADYRMDQPDPPYDGVIARATSRLAEQAPRRGVAVVNVWRNSPVVDRLPTVIPDTVLAGRVAAEHLIARGLRHFGTLMFRGDKLRHDLFRAFRERLSAEGFKCTACPLPVRFFTSPRGWDAGQRAMDEWIRKWRLPMGVLTSHDDFALILANRAASCHGLSVPYDLSLIGCGNESLACAMPACKLSSIDMNFRLVGYRAAELLDSLMDGAEPPRKGPPRKGLQGQGQGRGQGPAGAVLVEPKGLVARQSTDLLAVEDPVVGLAMRYMAENCHLPIHVRDVAAAAASSLRSLQRSFVRQTGRSIAEQLDRLRVERAKRLLVESPAPGKEIASQSGFGNYHHMCRAFQRREGMSPIEFRKRRLASLSARHETQRAE